jgi:hypothetical protein
LASLNPEQVKNIRTALSIARRRGASPKVVKALIEAMGVESNFTNVAGGDRDSEGVLQQRPSQGWKNPRDVPTAVNAFLDRAIPQRGKYGNAGELAQAVQRSAFPARYGQRGGEASRIISRFAPGINADGTASSPSFKASVTPGVDNRAVRNSAILDYFQNQRGRPGALLALKGTLDANQDTPSTMNYSGGKAPSTGGSMGAPSSTKGGTVMFDGKKVAAWIGEALQYAREQGWKGKVNSGFRTDAEQKRIYDSGVRPAAKPKAYGGGGSNHEGTVYPLGAIDVSEAAQLARILKRSPYAKKLVWAGSKDPVHFSHPHNGSY